MTPILGAVEADLGLTLRSFCRCGKISVGSAQEPWGLACPLLFISSCDFPLRDSVSTSVKCRSWAKSSLKSFGL